MSRKCHYKCHYHFPPQTVHKSNLKDRSKRSTPKHDVSVKFHNQVSVNLSPDEAAKDIWVHALEKQPYQRSEEDLDRIYEFLKTLNIFYNCHPYFLQQICQIICYTELDEAVVVYEKNTMIHNWYIVLSGELKQYDYGLVTDGHSFSHHNSTTVNDHKLLRNDSTTWKENPTESKNTTSANVLQDGKLRCCKRNVSTGGYPDNQSHCRALNFPQNCENDLIENDETLLPRKHSSNRSYTYYSPICYRKNIPQNLFQEIERDIATNHHEIIFRERNPIIRILNPGAVFGIEDLHSPVLPDCLKTVRQTTVITLSPCELLFVKQNDYNNLWQKNRSFLFDLNSAREKLMSTFDLNSTHEISDDDIRQLQDLDLQKRTSITANLVSNASIRPLTKDSVRNSELLFRCDTIDDQPADDNTPALKVQLRETVLSEPEYVRQKSLSDEMIRYGVVLLNSMKHSITGLDFSLDYQQVTLQPRKSPSRQLSYKRSPQHGIRYFNNQNCANKEQLFDCLVGQEMITWLNDVGEVDNRLLSLGAWQVLLEEGIIVSKSCDTEVIDGSSLYTFHETVFTLCASGSCNLYIMPTLSPTHGNPNSTASSPASSVAGDDIRDNANLKFVIQSLIKMAPDSLFRLILQKPPKERKSIELDFIFGELMHIQALSHFSTTVKRQLTKVLMYEVHPKAERVVFYQGMEGTSWYIILKGSVDVHIKGKGIVSYLQEGDDFGKLALVNNSPRAATIILHEDNCHFLRVDKDDFNRILRDVEANTVRLKEHGKDVLVLEKMTISSQQSSTPVSANYSVIAGTPDKIMEYLLENKIESSLESIHILNAGRTKVDSLVEDVLFTYPIFASSSKLCQILYAYFQSENIPQSTINHSDSIDNSVIPNDQLCSSMKIKKNRVIQFLHCWYRIATWLFIDDQAVQALLDQITSSLLADCSLYPSLRTALESLNTLNFTIQQEQCDLTRKTATINRSSFRKSMTTHSSTRSPKISIQNKMTYYEKPCIRSTDLYPFNVFTKSHTCLSQRMPVNSSVSCILNILAQQMGYSSGEQLQLIEVQSNGEKTILNSGSIGIVTSIGVNSRLFVIAIEDSLTTISPLVEQIAEPDTHAFFIETVNIEELACQFTIYDWELLVNIHIYELIFQVFGKEKFKRPSPNLDLLIRQFTVVQFWVVTVLCSNNNPSAKRVLLLKRFIKLSAKLLEMKNLNSFFAIMLGLNNSAVSRLQSTWEKLQGKYKKVFLEMNSMLDPSRNHRAFRQHMEKCLNKPPVIPFFAVLLKDLTFTHEGNKTYFDELVNFEKVRLLARHLRVLKDCRQRPLFLENANKDRNFAEIKCFVRNLKCIDDQKVLTKKSQIIEPRKISS